MLATGLSTLVTYNPWTISVDTTLAEMVRAIEQMGFHHLPVCDDDKQLLGIVSEHEVVRAVETLHAATLAPAVMAGERQLRRECQAEEIMHRRPVTIEEQQSPHEALALLLKHKVHSLPVVENNRLQGMLTSSDFLREFSYGSYTSARATVAEAMERTSDPVEINASLDEAKFALDLAGVHYLAVVRDDFPLGVISRRDIYKARYRHTVRALLGDVIGVGPTSVRELIHGAPTISPGRKLTDAAAIMMECRVQAVAVVNQANRLMGIVTEDIILERMLAAITE